MNVISNDELRNKKLKSIKNKKNSQEEENEIEYDLKILFKNDKDLSKKKIEKWCLKKLKRYDLFVEKQVNFFIENGFLQYYHLSDEINIEKENYAIIYTRGFYENYKQIDFQIILPMESSMSLLFFNILNNEIKNGIKFEEEKYYSNVIKGYTISFIKTFILNKKKEKINLLRIIFPFIPGILNMSNPENYFSNQSKINTENFVHQSFI